MSGFTDWTDAGIWPLQDHAHAQDGTPVSVRQQMAAGRIVQMTDPSETSAPLDTRLVYGRENGLGTLGDVHPWMFLQTRDRGVRGMGSWAQVFAGLAVEADPLYAKTGIQPFRDSQFRNDTRYAVKDAAWPACFPRIARGSVMLMLPGTDEAGQHELAMWADPRLIAPWTSGPGECGTLVCDLQPTAEICMDGSDKPGVNGRHARLQALLKVVAVQPGRALGDALGGAEGNTLALNFAETQQDDIPCYGAAFGYLDTRSPGPTTGGRPRGPITGVPSGPTTGGGGRGPITGQARLERSSIGETALPGTFGADLPGSAEEFAPKDFGSFAPVRISQKGIGFMAWRGAYGPIHLGAENDKHRHGSDRDGHPMNAAHIATEAYFYQDAQRDAPIAFEGDYPYPGPLPVAAPAHISYDAISQHQFGPVQRAGYWRLWCETPDVGPRIPGPDDPNVPPSAPPTGGKPPAPPTGGKPPGVPPTGGGGRPTTPGGGSGAPPANPVPPKPGLGRPITPNPGGKRFPGYPATPTGPTGPVTPGPGSPTEPGGGTPAGPTTPGGSGGQPSVPCKDDPRKVAPLPSTRSPLPHTRLPLPLGPEVRRRSARGPRGSGLAGSIPSEPSTRGSSILPAGARMLNLAGGELAPVPADPGRGSSGTIYTDPRLELGRLSGLSGSSRLPQEVPGVVETIGTTDGRTALYALFRPMAQGFAALQFRPEMTANGFPCFEHNPQMPAPMYYNDEARRPQALAMHAWGGQSAAENDWAYVEAPEASRARGGTINGGVVFHPPRFEMADYYGIGGVVADVDDVTSDRATVGYVLFAPGVRAAWGKPLQTGALAAGAFTAHPIAGTWTLAQDGVALVEAIDDGTDVLVRLGRGGTGAVSVPVGTTAQRPTTLEAGQVRFNSTTGYLEYYDGSAWQTGGGGGGGVTDHGALTGLADDDHTQYHNDTRGDARYYTQSAADALLAAKQPLATALTAIGAITPAADQFAYFTGASSAALATLTPFALSILDDADDAAVRATIGAAATGDIPTVPEGVTYKRVDFHSTYETNVTLTNLTAAARFLKNSTGGIKLADLTGCSEVRLSARITTAGVAGSRIRLYYRVGSYSGTFGDYTTIGDSADVDVVLTSATLATSGWLDMDTTAANETVYLALGELDGDGVADPVIRAVWAEFR